MSAILLSQLKTKIASLGENFNQPQEFLHQLRDLLESHANLVYRPGQSVQPSKKLRVLHIPPLVLDQIENDLRPFCRKNPEAVLKLVDNMWESTSLEEHILSAGFIGYVPLDYSAEVVRRIKLWSQPGCDETVLEAILHNSCQELRREDPDLWVEIIHEWLGSNTSLYQKLGLKALLPLVNDEAYKNLPLLFRLIDPVIRSAPPNLQNELQSVLVALSRRTPDEIGYFLQRIILTEAEFSPIVARLIRRVIPILPAEAQANLRGLLKNQ